MNLDEQIAERLFDGDQPPRPRFSTDIWDAWLVVEKMRERGWGYSLGSLESRSPAGMDGQHHAMFIRYHDGVRDCRMASASRAPEAICKAALRALDADGA